MSLSLLGCGSDDDAGPEKPAAGNPSGAAQQFFVALARRSTISRTGEEDRYRLTLSGVDPRVLWFSESPQQRSGQITLDRFVALFRGDEPFAKDPPNAALEALSRAAGGETSERYAVELDKPAYAREQNRVRFQVRALDGAQRPLSEISGAVHVTLFVDPCLGCVG